MGRIYKSRTFDALGFADREHAIPPSVIPNRGQ